MRRTNEILKRLLQKIAAKDGHTDLKKAADSLIHHDWEETGDRATFYKELGALLRHDPFDLQAVKKSVQSKGGTAIPVLASDLKSASISVYLEQEKHDGNQLVPLWSQGRESFQWQRISFYRQILYSH